MSWKIACTLGFMVFIIPGETLSTRSKRNLVFLPGSGMGLYLALALPIDLPKYEISMSFNFEANYDLPSNATELALGPYFTEIRKGRSLTRTKVYSFIEEQLESRGFLGKDCLLRAICETQANPIFGHNGVVGDLIHILFTPSTTTSENLPFEYSGAENAGRTALEACDQLYANCSINLYDLFTIWNN